MRASALRKHYPALTPDERFRLAMAALARGDDDDLALLRTTCPKRTYEATDEEFQGQWERSARVMHCFSHLWLVTLLRLKEAEVALVRARTALDYFREGYVYGANAAWQEAGENGAYLEMEDITSRDRRTQKENEKPDKQEHAYLWQCCEVKTVWAGFARFCAAVGFAPEMLLGWWSASGEYIEPVGWVLESDLPIDEVGADEMCRMHLWLWNQRAMVIGKVEI